MARDLPAVSVAALLTTGCVFPAFDATGIEFSWIFLESNDADGEEGQRARTCEGAGIEDVNITITDLGDETRTRTFPRSCEAGYQSVQDFQLVPSDVFISLRPGEYRVLTEAVSGAGVASTRDEREVTVSARGLTVVALDLPIPVVDWSLAVKGEDSCQTVGFTLIYGGPDTTLSEPPETEEGGEDGEEAEVVYRSELVADTNLSLGGAPIDCADAGGVHTFRNVDLGAYRILVDVDGTTCSLATRIDRPELTLELDLASLPCAG